ncbi:MAG: hypothetical protein OEY85_04935 [Rhodospirillales bacterium]|nr:hypothetical protein [Rhodospirillales bacterium]
MSADDRANGPRRTEESKRKAEERNKRLSSTLRDNLNKRKRQARARAEENDPAGKSPSGPTPD